MDKKTQGIAEGVRKNLGAAKIRLVKKEVDDRMGWGVYMFETLHNVQEKDQFGNTLREIASNRYVTVDLRPQNLGSGGTYTSQNSRESRKVAEDRYDHAVGQMKKYRERGHL